MSVATQIIRFCVMSGRHLDDQIGDHIGGYLKSPAKSASGQGVCGCDMSPSSGTCETRNIKSGSEKGTGAGHVGDITSGAAETPL